MPQGWVLGLLLFLLCVNDLPYASKFETTLFADDTNLHLLHNNIDSLQTQAEHETIKIDNWVNINKLTINYKKSYFMIVGNKNAAVSSFKLSINNNLLAGAKLGNVGAPRNHVSGPPKIFFLDGDAKEQAPKGRCQARGSGGIPPQKNLRNLTLFWRLVVRFEPLKFLSFNKV